MPCSQREPVGDWILDTKIAKLVRRKSRQLSRSAGFNTSDESDFEQEIWLELIQKFSQYNPALAKKTTFASQIIESKAASIVRAARAQKRSFLNEALSLNNAVQDDEGNSLELAQNVEEAAGRNHTGQQPCSNSSLTQLRMDIADANEQLPFELKQMVALLAYVSEYTAANVLGISRRQAARQVALIRSLYEERNLSLQ